MKEETNKKHTRRLRNLVILFVLLAVFISVSTYAWFIGMRTVNVSPFDVEIAAIDGLTLSLNGADWSESVKINKDTFNDPVYEADDNPNPVYVGNTNKWAGRGLIPASSVGEMDTDASRLVIFEKAGLTATPGGYKLIASRVPNHDWAVPTVPEEEPDGYVVFDLFIKNKSGRQYLETLDLENEEAIYLTVDSTVKISETGGVVGTGIENSVRVGFAQIGRVIGNLDTVTGTDDDNIEAITGITCTNGAINGVNVTGICGDGANQRRATIWEPNETAHVQSAINWYKTSCKERDTATTYTTNPCTNVINGIFSPTYAVNTAIESGDRVDVYDGAEYNKYTSTSQLTAVKTFTDFQKNLRGTERPALFTLEPNSITKVRVYIWLEGQDVDNYDFASIGKMITVSFGFTKQRYTEEDIAYGLNGEPDVNQGYGPMEDEFGRDLTPPIITIMDKVGPAEISTLNVVLGNDDWMDDIDVTAYDPGLHGMGDVTSSIKWTDTVDVNTAQTYLVTFSANDGKGNYTTKVLEVVVGP